MGKLKPELDIVLDILQIVATAYPENTFSQSILHQYQERGGLSKKQLQGLYGKAQNLTDIPSNKLATLEAIILRKHEKTKSELPTATPLYTKDHETGEIIKKILDKFPNHKRVLFLQSKFENNEILTGIEVSELKSFLRLIKS